MYMYIHACVFLWWFVCYATFCFIVELHGTLTTKMRISDGARFMEQACVIECDTPSQIHQTHAHTVLGESVPVLV